jgi:hypothetical protein
MNTIYSKKMLKMCSFDKLDRRAEWLVLVLDQYTHIYTWTCLHAVTQRSGRYVRNRVRISVMKSGTAIVFR